MSDEILFPDRMAPVDAMFWRLERDRRLRTTTMAVAILDKAPDLAAVRAMLERAVRRIPRLRQRVVELPGSITTPLWQTDPDFDLDYHLRSVAAPEGGDAPFLLELAASMAMQAFDRSRPLWEFVLVERLAGHRAALIQKLHHSVGDGAAGVALMGQIYDVDRSASEALSPAEPTEEPGPQAEEGVLALAGRALAEDLVDVPRASMGVLAEGVASIFSPRASAARALAELRGVAGIMRSGPGPFSPLMQARSSRCRLAALPIERAALGASGRACGCTYNDAFLAAVASGLGRYHRRRQAPVDALRAAIPISVRDAEGALTMGNRLSIGRFSIPTEEMDPRRRMRAIHECVLAQRKPASLGAFEVVARFVNRSPTALVLPLILDEMTKSDVVATVFPGPEAPLYVAGSLLENLYTFGPTAGAALNVTAFGYRDEATVAFTLDPAAVPDSQLMVECVREGIEEVLAVA